jgi:hypothetical protein
VGIASISEDNVQLDLITLPLLMKMRTLQCCFEIKLRARSCALSMRSLLEVNCFDEILEFCENDMYLRIAQKYAIATHPMIVAEYRRHSQNVFSDFKRTYVWGALFLTAMLRELPQTPLHSRLSGTDEQIARRYHAALLACA